MNRLRQVLALVALLATLFIVPVFAQNDAGPNDVVKSHDYARHIGRSTDRKLSTGWTHGKGTRTYRTRDYVRHTRSGRTVHVHGYYHSRH